MEHTTDDTMEQPPPDSSAQFSDPGQDGGQLALFDPAEIEELSDPVEVSKRPAGYTHEQFQAASSKVAGIAAALAAGASYRDIEKAFNVSHRTISKVKVMRPDLIEQTRKLLSAKWLALSDICVDTLTEKALAGQLPANIAAMVGGVAVDKANILDNRPTSITENHNAGNAETDRLRAELARLQKGDLGPVLDAEVIPDSPGLDSTSSVNSSENP